MTVFAFFPHNTVAGLSTLRTGSRNSSSLAIGSSSSARRSIRSPSPVCLIFASIDVTALCLSHDFFLTVCPSRTRVGAFPCLVRFFSEDLLPLLSSRAQLCLLSSLFVARIFSKIFRDLPSRITASRRLFFLLGLCWAHVILWARVSGLRFF